MDVKYRATLLMSEFVTHDVKRFVVTKPKGLTFEPGQGVELAINQDEWKDEGRPFTPTNLVIDQVLEFTIKRYSEHKGVTHQLHNMRPGEELLMSDAFGTIRYDGPGVFLAGGAGITPFISILREQAFDESIGNCTLIFSNKTPDDIIYEKELRHYLQDRCVLTCTDESKPGYLDRLIDKEFLTSVIDDFNQRFYVCGPPGFMDAVTEALKALGADPESLVFEQ